MSALDKVGSFFSSKENLSGSAAAAAAAGLKIAGLLGSGWFVVAGLGYGFAFVLAKQLRGKELALIEDLDDEAARRKASAFSSLKRIEAACQSERRRLGGAADVAAEIARQTAAVLASLSKDSEGLSGVEMEGEACRIALDYLPGLIDGFLSIQEQFASKARIDGEKTAKDLLDEKLMLLSAEVDELSKRQALDDAKGFMRHAKFLGEKFGSNDFFGR